jgi:alkylated DNA repair protein alkB family protein 8
MEYETQYVTNVYGKIAPYFNERRVFTWSWIANFINSIEHNSTILDIGCGNGRNMQNPKYNFIGLDLCHEFVDMCNKRGMTCMYGDMCNMPIESNSMDAIISIASFHHLSNKERRISALNEIKRVLKPDGKILLSVWSIEQPKKTRRTFTKYGDTIVSWNQYGKDYDRFYYIFRLDEIRNLFKETNIEIVDYQWDCGNEVFILKI